MRDILYLDGMLTPKIITFVYWLLLLGTAFTGLGFIFSDFSIGRLLMGVLATAFGAVGVRIWCELLIVLFKIHENLSKIADQKVETH